MSVTKLHQTALTSQNIFCTENLTAAEWTHTFRGHLWSSSVARNTKSHASPKAMRVPSVKIFSFYITLSYLALETFRSSDKQIYRALVKKTKNKKCSRCAHITDVWEVQLLLCSFLTSKQNGRSRQLHATAACLLKKPLVVTTKQESGWAPGPVWELWWREQPLASVGNQTTISRSSNQQWQYRLRHATPRHATTFRQLCIKQSITWFL
jgi:hypothetical protein